MIAVNTIPDGINLTVRKKKMSEGQEYFGVFDVATGQEVHRIFSIVIEDAVGDLATATIKFHIAKEPTE